MKTLTELYSERVIDSPPVLTDIYFKAAFPETWEKEVKRLRRLSEDLFEDFYKNWEVRIRQQLKDELAAGSSPHTILKLVHFITADELKDLMKLADEFLSSDNEYFQVLKLRELESHVVSCMQQAGEIFKELYAEEQEAMRKGKIKRVPLIQPIQG